MVDLKSVQMLGNAYKEKVRLFGTDAAVVFPALAREYVLPALVCLSVCVCVSVCDHDN